MAQFSRGSVLIHYCEIFMILLEFMVSRIKTLIYAISYYLEPLNMLVMWQGRTKVARGIKVTNQLILRWGIFLGLSRWAPYNDKGPYKWKNEAGESEKELW